LRSGAPAGSCEVWTKGGGGWGVAFTFESRQCRTIFSGTKESKSKVMPLPERCHHSTQNGAMRWENLTLPVKRLERSKWRPKCQRQQHCRTKWRKRTNTWGSRKELYIEERKGREIDYLLKQQVLAGPEIEVVIHAAGVGPWGGSQQGGWKEIPLISPIGRWVSRLF